MHQFRFRPIVNDKALEYWDILNVCHKAERHYICTSVVSNFDDYCGFCSFCTGIHNIVIKRRINKIKMSILTKAFHGELVPQDPNDVILDLRLDTVKVRKKNEIRSSKV